jgi:xanthine dehydrogenase YagS FAD-binding subunit
MHAFDYAAPTTLSGALGLAGPGSAYLAGGTTLVDLMKLDVLGPDHVIDINALPLLDISQQADGLHIGALARMSDVATSQLVTGGYPLLSRALLLSASPQVRNMASIGGNLLQRTRCDYFRDVHTGCNKRSPGSGCPARTGANRTHAILGTSDDCVATQASDLAVALVALSASVRLTSTGGDRLVELDRFYQLPGSTPQVENVLRQGELITEVIVPAVPPAMTSTYVKVRDRQSFEFALASAAVAVDATGGTVNDVRVAVGGVATVPWRLPAVEAALRGQPATIPSFTAAAALAVIGAIPLAHNAFKVNLVQRVIIRALVELVGAT